MDKKSHRMANLAVFSSDGVVEKRPHHSSESVIVKPRSYDSNESRTEVNRATQHIALDVEKKEQEYLKIRLEHSSALQTLAAEIQQLVIPSPRINQDQSIPALKTSSHLTSVHGSNSSKRSMPATSTVELESLSIPAGYEGAATSEWIQKMVLDSVVQSQQRQIQQLQQQVHTLTEQTTKLHQPPSGVESHQLFERYRALLSALQSQLASMETKQITYENLTNKKLFDLASRIEVLEISHRNVGSETRKRSSDRVTRPESSSVTLIAELTRRLEQLESSPSTTAGTADKRSFYNGSPTAGTGAGAAVLGLNTQVTEAESYDSMDSVGSGRRRRSGRERNRSRKIKVEGPRLDFENLAIQLTSTEKRHYPWLSNDDSV